VPDLVAEMFNPVGSVVYRDSRAAAVLYAIPLALAERSLAGTDLRPICLAGYAVVNAAWFDYGESTIGAYREFSLGVMASQEKLRIATVAQLLLGKAGAVGAHILALPVDSELARAGGVARYGLPKTLVDFSLGWTKSSLTATIETNARQVLAMQLPLHRGIPAWLRQLVIFSRLEGRLLTTTISTRWFAQIDLVGRPRLAVEDRSHPLGELVTQLGLETAPVMAIVHGKLVRAELPEAVESLA
jgi:hypothetical protein